MPAKKKTSRKSRSSRAGSAKRKKSARSSRSRATEEVVIEEQRTIVPGATVMRREPVTLSRALGSVPVVEQTAPEVVEEETKVVRRAPTRRRVS